MRYTNPRLYFTFLYKYKYNKHVLQVSNFINEKYRKQRSWHCVYFTYANDTTSTWRYYHQLLDRSLFSGAILNYTICCRERALIFLPTVENFAPLSFSHVTHVFVCKQVVISFGVLFICFLSVILSICLYCCIKFVSLSSEIGLSPRIVARTNVRSFKVAILFFCERALAAKG